jgi:hypothetical protein
MTKRLALFAALVITIEGCGGRPLNETFPAESPKPDANRAFLLHGDMYFTPCVTVFGPIARGQLFDMAVGRLDDTGTASVNVDATLAITDGYGSSVPFEHIRTGTFRMRFARAGSYTLTAMLDDGTNLTENVDVVEQAGLRLSPLYRRITTNDESGECAETENTFLFAPGGPVRLSKNQNLTTSVVPVDANDMPLLGHVDVEFSGTMKIGKSTTWGGSNSFTFEPTQTGFSTVRVTDTTLRQVNDLSFEVADAHATCPAPD